jgi:hypothetical protein
MGYLQGNMSFYRWEGSVGFFCAFELNAGLGEKRIEKFTRDTGSEAVFDTPAG